MVIDMNMMSLLVRACIGLTKQNPKRRSAGAVVAIFTAALSVAAQSNPIPADMLALDHQRCMQGCVPGYGEATCKPLCDCTVTEFKKTMSFDEYLDMSVQLSRNEISPALREYLDKVANYCAAELERSGVEIGSGKAEDTGQR